MPSSAKLSLPKFTYTCRIAISQRATHSGGRSHVLSTTSLTRGVIVVVILGVEVVAPGFKHDNAHRIRANIRAKRRLIDDDRKRPRREFQRQPLLQHAGL